MKVQIEQWEHDFSQEERLYLISLVHNKEGLLVLLENESLTKQYEIKFKSSLFYSCSDESQRLRLLEEVPMIGVAGAGHVFLCLDSRLINWLIEQSHDILDTQHLKHFIICSSDEILEIITYDDPQITSPIE